MRCRGRACPARNFAVATTFVVDLQWRDLSLPERLRAPRVVGDADPYKAMISCVSLLSPHGLPPKKPPLIRPCGATFPLGGRQGEKLLHYLPLHKRLLDPIALYRRLVALA